MHLQVVLVFAGKFSSRFQRFRGSSRREVSSREIESRSRVLRTDSLEERDGLERFLLRQKDQSQVVVSVVVGRREAQNFPELLLGEIDLPRGGVQVTHVI